MDTIVNKLTENFISQGPFALILVALWILWIKPRTEADIRRVAVEAEASAKRMECDAESNKLTAESMSRIADAVDSITEESLNHNRVLKRIVEYTVQGLKGQLDNKPEETKEALTSLQAIVKE